MGNKKTTQQYRWQPELSLTLIYWSLTFGVFFLGIISWLEETRINLFAIGSFIVFAFFLIIGCCRIIKIQNKTLIIRSLLKRNAIQTPLTEIKDISVGSKGLTIYFEETNSKKDVSMMMATKTKEEFLSELSEQSDFNGDIYRVEKSAE